MGFLCRRQYDAYYSGSNVVDVQKERLVLTPRLND